MTSQEIFNEVVSVYKFKGDNWQVKLGDTTLMNVLQMAKHFEKETQRARQLYARWAHTKDYIDELAYKNYKKLYFPAVTFSAQFEDKRRLCEPHTLTHTIALDVDHIKVEQNLKIDYVKRVLMSLPGVYYCQTSASGDGVWALAAVDINEDRGRIYNYYSRELRKRDIVLDSLADETRLRFVTYDPQYKFKSKFEMLALTKYIENQTVKIKSKINPMFFRDRERFDYECIKDVINKGLWTSEPTFKAWAGDAGLIATAVGEIGRSLFYDLSRNSPEYKNEKDCDRVFNYALKHKHLESRMPKIYKLLKDYYGKDWRDCITKKISK